MNKMLTSTPKGSLEIPASSASSERRDLSVPSSGAGGSTTYLQGCRCRRVFSRKTNHPIANYHWLHGLSHTGYIPEDKKPTNTGNSNTDSDSEYEDASDKVNAGAGAMSILVQASRLNLKMQMWRPQW